MIKDFDEIVDECRELHRKKAGDYANDKDPYLNFRITGLTGISTRLVDKSVRLFNVWENKKINVTDETIEDTIKDIIVLGIIALSWFRGEEQEMKEVPKPEGSGGGLIGVEDK